MSLIDDIRKALQGEKKSEFVDQILKEQAFYDALHKAGLTVTAADPTERGRLQPFGVLSKVQKIDLVDLITEITTIKTIENIDLIDLITRIALIDNITNVGTLNLLNTVNLIKSISSIDSITSIGKINQVNMAISNINLIKNPNFNNDWDFWDKLPTSGVYAPILDPTYSYFGIQSVKLPTFGNGQIWQYVQGYITKDLIIAVTVYATQDLYHKVQVYIEYEDLSLEEFLGSAEVGIWWTNYFKPTSSKRIRRIIILNIDDTYPIWIGNVEMQLDVDAISSEDYVYLTTASDVVKNSNDAEKTTTSTDWVKLKEITVLQAINSVRILFDLKTSDAGVNAYGRIYLNTNAIGTIRFTQSVTYVTFSEDFDGFSVGDNIQLYAKINTAGYTAYVQHFRLAYDMVLAKKVQNTLS
jgi:hypothetical protein